MEDQERLHTAVCEPQRLPVTQAVTLTGESGRLGLCCGDRGVKWGSVESMLLGEYDHTLDDKNRLTLPAKFRQALAGGVVLTRGLDACVEAYPAERLAQLVESCLAGLNPLSHETRVLERFYYTGAVESEPDKQGRVMLPPVADRARGARPRGGRRGDARPARDLGSRFVAHPAEGGNGKCRACCRTSCSPTRLTTSPSSRTRSERCSRSSPATRWWTAPLAQAAMRPCSRAI